MYSEDALHTVLKLVVAPRAPVVHALSDESVHMLLRLSRAHTASPWEKTLFQVADQSAPPDETGQVRLAVQHHFYQKDDPLCVLLQSCETPSHPRPVVIKFVARLSPQHIYHLLGQLERGSLHFNTLAWRITQQESEVNVRKVTLNVDHNIAVVPILDL